MFNHGAQYFKITTESFKQFLNPLIQKKIIKPWIANFVEINKDIMVKKIIGLSATGHFRGTLNEFSIKILLHNFLR